MIYTGRTVEEALLKMEKDTGKSRESIIYSISEKKSSLFGSKKVIVDVKGYKERGKIEIKNNMVIYHPGDINPSITPGKNVLIRVNNNIIHSKTFINEYDVVEVEPVNTYSSRTININISDDKIIAYIDINYVPEKKFQIHDLPPQSDIIVDAECIDEKYPQPYSKSDIEELIKINNIKYGIQWENIPAILKGGKNCIAKGLLPQDPIDDNIKFLYNFNREKKPTEKNGKVDFLSIGAVDTVEPGTIIAVKEEGKDGTPGYDIYGNIIQARKRKKCILKNGPGTELVNNGNSVAATIKGLVSIRNNIICVFPVYTINGDVDIKTGNVKFDGDIVVTGNVSEGLKINAGNNINIFGSVAGASISSRGNILIEKNVITSMLKAGDREIDDLKTIQYLKAYIELLNDLISVDNEINKSVKIPQNSDIGTVFKVLLQSKYRSLKEQILEGISFISRNPVSEEIKKLWNDGTKLFRLIEDGRFNNINYAVKLNNNFKDFINKHDVISAPADIIINYSQNSNIYATNNVEVKGKGCYNTNIIANNKVIFTGYPGIIRGGQIFGANGINAREVGSSAGVLTVLRTSKDGIIEAEVVYQNTVITIGEQSYRIENPVKMLKAYMDKGEIVVEKLKL